MKAPRYGAFTQLVVEHEGAGEPQDAQGVGPHRQRGHEQQGETHEPSAEREHRGERTHLLAPLGTVADRVGGGVESGDPGE